MTNGLRTVAAVMLLACAGLCLPTTAWSQASIASPFDHFTTGFRLDGAHRFAQCQSCHVDGQFEGTPTECGGCHVHASRVQATAQPAGHLLASEHCESCHRTSMWVPVARVDHLEVVGTCQSCHNGMRAMGKPSNHVQASDQCDDCHRTATFAGATFDHAGIAGGCFACHDGSRALGKFVGHMPTTNLCEDCHRPIRWSPVARVDHLQVLGTCSTCHNGTIAMGQKVGHIPTTQECDACHNVTTWKR
jgi:hypothetical protein